MPFKGSMIVGSFYRGGLNFSPLAICLRCVTNVSGKPVKAELVNKVCTNNMVGRVLRNHKIVDRDRTTKTYSLVGYKELTEDERESLGKLCEKQFAAFVEARGRASCDH
jgi:hypothetical protein